MGGKMSTATHPTLPLRQEITRPRIISFGIAVIMTIMSLLGLIFPEFAYKTDTLIQTLFPNDLVNILIGLPFLLGSIWLVSRERLVGLLLWPGALLFIFYNYVAYIIGRSLDLLSIIYLALVLFSAFIFYDLLHRIDKKNLKLQLSGKVAEKLAAWFLLIFGILFILRAIFEFTSAGANTTEMLMVEIGVLAADILISVLWVVGGILLLRQSPLGYSMGLGLLSAASMLFVGLIIFLVIQPIITDAAFKPTDILVVAVMGLILSIPFFFYLRGTIKSSEY
jgi:hypothetical protein